VAGCLICCSSCCWCCCFCSCCCCCSTQHGHGELRADAPLEVNVRGADSNLCTWTHTGCLCATGVDWTHPWGAVTPKLRHTKVMLAADYKMLQPWIDTVLSQAHCFLVRPLASCADRSDSKLYGPPASAITWRWGTWPPDHPAACDNRRADTAAWIHQLVCNIETGTCSCGHHVARHAMCIKCSST
jgi:hypothetical protein